MDGGELESYRHFAANVSHVSGAAVVFRGASCEEHFWIFKRGRLIHDEITDWELVEHDYWKNEKRSFSRLYLR